MWWYQISVVVFFFLHKDNRKRKTGLEKKNKQNKEILQLIF